MLNSLILLGFAFIVKITTFEASNDYNPTKNSIMLKKLFGFDSSKHSLRAEVVAGITTFLTMSYILAVNPDIFTALPALKELGGSIFTSTALAAIIGCFAMAFYGKLPFGLAPGMGLNAFFVYTVCLGMGYDWTFALTAVFLEGLIFILMTGP